MGNYSTLPTSPIAFSGSHGSGARAFYSNIKLANQGTGCSVGDILFATNGTWRSRARIQVTSVSSGAVKGFGILGGGAYTATLATYLELTSAGRTPEGNNLTMATARKACYQPR
jgi:hypothetical protein